MLSALSALSLLLSPSFISFKIFSINDAVEKRLKWCFLKNTFILLGLTGKGKSQIIRFLSGNPNVIVSNSLSSCTKYASLYYGVIQIDSNHEEFFCLIDTAGLCDSKGPKQDEKNYNDIKNILLYNKCEIKGIFMVENFQDERMNGEEKKIIEAACDLFPLKNFCQYLSIIYTHYYNKGSTSRVKIKKDQQAQLSNSLKEMLENVKRERIPNIDVDETNIHKLYVNIENNIIEKKILIWKMKKKKNFMNKD